MSKQRRLRRTPRDSHRDHRHTEAPTPAGDAGTGPSTTSSTASRDCATGPITKIGRVFGAGAVAALLVALTVTYAFGTSAVGTSAVSTTATPGRISATSTVPSGVRVQHGRVSRLRLPAAADEYVAFSAQPSGRGAWAIERDGSVTAAGAARLADSFATHPAIDPAVGIAAATDRGYWIVTELGRVRAYGDARSLGSHRLPFGARHIVGITAQPNGSGYWLVANDGAIYSFGAARDHGDVSGVPLSSPIVAIAATPSGRGYYLLSGDGAVFAFGDARHRGAPLGIIGRDDAVGIAADPDRLGYSIALRNGAVLAYASGKHRPAPVPTAPLRPQAVAIGAAGPGGMWTLHGRPRIDHLHPFLVCTRSHESSHTAPAYDDGYGAINPSGTYRGAYQFSRSTWDSTARHAGRDDLVGIDPASATQEDQDGLALALYEWQGADPWRGRCAGR